MAKKKYYMVVDTETSTLPCAGWICENDEDRKKVAIARPLIYDFGYTIVERNGNIIKKVNHLVRETYFNHDIFDLGYYANKRNIYDGMLMKGEIDALSWDEIMEEFLADLATVDGCGAFNSMFDFKKAIPFTELFIRKLYSNRFGEWCALQETLCRKIINERYHKDDDREYDPYHFNFRNADYPLFDLWGLSCKYLINHAKYKNFCLENGMVTATGLNFKTSAEAVYRYIMKDSEFSESHTALDDAIIESKILGEITKRTKIEDGIIAFPFKILGVTTEHIVQYKKPSQNAINNVLNAMNEYLGEVDRENCTAYQKRIINHMDILGALLNI